MALQSAWLRAISAALIAALGFTVIGAPAFADTTTTSSSTSANANAPATTNDVAQASNPFADVPANHWAYDAVRQLAADGYIQGYPDGQFKGQRPMTRYEMAVLTDRAVRSIEAKLAQLQQVEQRDIAAVRQLVNAFRPELDQLKQQVAALQAKQADQDKALADLKKQADASTLRLNQMKIGANFWDRPGTGSQNIQVFNPATGTYAASGTTGSAGASGGANSVTAGVFAHGTNYWAARLVASGQLDPRWSYGMRLFIAREFQSNFAGSGASSLNTAYCTTVPNSFSTATGAAAASNVPSCSFEDGQSKMPVFLDYAYAGYTSPGGIYGQIGRYSVGQSKYLTNPQGLLFGGQSITGATVGFKDPAGRLDLSFYYGLPNFNGAAIAAADAANITSGSPCTHLVTGSASGVVGLNTGPIFTTFNGINPFCNQTPMEIGADGTYFFPSTGTAIGFAYDSWFAQPFAFWDPAAVGCTGTAQSAVAVSAGACTANGGAVTAASAAGPGNFFTVQGNPAAADIFVHQSLGNHELPQFSIEAEVARRLGSDPFTGAAWAGANAVSASVQYASKGNIYNAGVPEGNLLIPSYGADNSNVVQFSVGYYGLNSLGGIETGNFAGSSSFQNQLGISNPDGMMFFMVQLQHWFTKYVRAGITAIHGQLIPGVTLPVSTYSGTGAASANGCPGCFVNTFNSNQIYLDTFLVF